MIDQARTSPAGASRSWLHRDRNGQLLAVGFLARLPLGMSAVLPLLLVLSRTGSAAAAGGAVAAYGCGLCLAAPWWGRRADRLGAASVLRGCAWLSMLATTALAACPPEPVLLLACTAVLGGCAPPTNAVMRALWQRRLGDEAERREAASAESVVAELVHIAGRTAVAVLALALPLTTIVLFQGVLLVGATEWLLRLRSPGPGLADAQPASSRAAGSGRLLLRLPLIYLNLGLLSAALGATSTGIALLADPGGGSASAAAFALASWGAGSAVGGLILARTRPLPVSLLLLGPGLGAVLVAVHGPVPLPVVAFVAGLPIAPALTGLYRRLQGRAPTAHATEALTLATGALFLGNAGGAALGGIVITTTAVPALVLAAILALLAASGSALSTAAARRHRFRTNLDAGRTQ